MYLLRFLFLQNTFSDYIIVANVCANFNIFCIVSHHLKRYTFIDGGDMIRKTYCDYLRLVATFAVVVVHVAASNWSCTDVNGLEWRIFNFYDSIVRWSVPIFVMIGGTLFLNRETEIKRIYSKYILRMVIAFFAWSVFYLLTTPVFYENGLIYGVKAHIAVIFSGHYHMWYVLMIIGIYMCIPFYKKIVSDTFVMKYFLVLSFIFTLLIPWSIQLLNDYAVGYNEILAKLVDAASSNLSTMSMHTVLGYSFYFVLGYYLDSIQLRKNQRAIIYILGIVGFVFTVLVSLDLALKTQQPCSTYYGFFRVNIMLEVICVHTFFKYQAFKNERLNSFVFKLSRYTFGVYLIHVFFIDKLSLYFNFNTLSFNAVAAVPIIACIVFICSLLTSAVLNYIPIIKKYCV